MYGSDGRSYSDEKQRMVTLQQDGDGDCAGEEKAVLHAVGKERPTALAKHAPSSLGRDQNRCVGRLLD